MFVCEGAYAEALRRILDAYVAVAGGKTDTPAAWISGFYGSGKSLLAAMLGALWTNHAFPDGMTAEGLIQGALSTCWGEVAIDCDEDSVFVVTPPWRRR